MWQIAADLHAMNFPHSNQEAKSLQRKYLKLANEQLGSGNPTMSRPTLLAKEIKEAINVKASVTNPDLTDFFAEDGAAVGEDDEKFDEIEGLDAEGVPVPDSVEVVPFPGGESEPSVLSSVPEKHAATSKKTRTNLLVSTVADSTNGTTAAVSTIMQQRQMSKDAEWRFRRME